MSSEYFENIVVTGTGEERIISWHNTVLFDDAGNITGTLSSGEDITNRKKMEKELLKSQKMESLSVLAGGIAHDFNNLLTAILGNISIAKTAANSSNNTTVFLTEAEKASMRAKGLTQQLLTFSKGGAPIKETIYIDEIIKDTVSFALRGSNIRSVFSISDNLYPVEVDKGQISQVINNLIINAIQAMPEGGTIHVSVENISVEKKNPLSFMAGKYIKISVEDHGVGIPEKHIQKIFDPYFTTKGKGSGLGLATAYSIVKKHEGNISVESKDGIGTTFYVYLPVSNKKISIKRKGIQKQVL